MCKYPIRVLIRVPAGRGETRATWVRAWLRFPRRLASIWDTDLYV